MPLTYCLYHVKFAVFCSHSPVQLMFQSSYRSYPHSCKDHLVSAVHTGESDP